MYFLIFDCRVVYIGELDIVVKYAMEYFDIGKDSGIHYIIDIANDNKILQLEDDISAFDENVMDTIDFCSMSNKVLVTWQIKKMKK